MKKVKLIISILLAITSITSCNKTDERDKFVGTWTGNLCFARIGTEYSTIVIITKDTKNSTQIILTETGESSHTGTINGSSYLYQSFKASLGITGNYSGSGSLGGNIITETGVITSDNAWFQGDLGDWNRTLHKQ